MTDTVTLANGKTVSLDEFLTWNRQKQNNQLRPPNLGRKFSNEVSEKIKNSRRIAIENGAVYNIRKGGDAGMSRKVKTPNGIFPTIKEAAFSHKVLGETIRRRAERGCDGYEFFNGLIPIKKLYESKYKNSRKVITPIGVFESVKEAANAYEVTRYTIKNWIDIGKQGFSFAAGEKQRLISFSPNRRTGKNNPASRTVMTPSGKFQCLSDAAKHYGVTSNAMWRWVNRSRTSDFKYYNDE